MQGLAHITQFLHIHTVLSRHTFWVLIFHRQPWKIYPSFSHFLLFPLIFYVLPGWKWLLGYLRPLMSHAGCFDDGWGPSNFIAPVPGSVPFSHSESYYYQKFLRFPGKYIFLHFIDMYTYVCRFINIDLQKRRCASTLATITEWNKTEILSKGKGKRKGEIKVVYCLSLLDL